MAPFSSPKKTSNNVTRMLNKLCQVGSYACRFFTVQSLRRSYANRIVAEVFCQCGSVAAAMSKISDGVRWDLKSTVAERYLDKNLPNYFGQGRRLTWEQFVELHIERRLLANVIRAIIGKEFAELSWGQYAL